MDAAVKYPSYACQFCGSTNKLVETIIDDEFVWDDSAERYEPNEYSDEFEHTGEERCASCGEDWTGLREQSSYNK